jgi:hypothetical protein
MGKKCIGHGMSVSVSLQLITETYFALINISQVTLKMRADVRRSLCVTCSLLLSNFNQSWRVGQIVAQLPYIKFHENLITGS